MDEIQARIVAFFLKAWIYIVYIGIGLIGVFAEKIRKGKKMSWWEVLSTTLIALFVGYLASVVCIRRGWVEESAYIVPIATLLSDKLFTGILAYDWKGLINALIDKYRNGKGDKS